jgi:hypothetical protein
VKERVLNALAAAVVWGQAALWTAFLALVAWIILRAVFDVL